MAPPEPFQRLPVIGPRGVPRREELSNGLRRPKVVRAGNVHGDGRRRVGDFFLHTLELGQVPVQWTRFFHKLLELGKALVPKVELVERLVVARIPQSRLVPAPRRRFFVVKVSDVARLVGVESGPPAVVLLVALHAPVLGRDRRHLVGILGRPFRVRRHRGALRTSLLRPRFFGGGLLSHVCLPSRGCGLFSIPLLHEDVFFLLENLSLSRCVSLSLSLFHQAHSLNVEAWTRTCERETKLCNDL